MVLILLLEEWGLGRTLMSLCNVEPDVWDWVSFQFVDKGNNIGCNNINRNNASKTLLSDKSMEMTYGNREQNSHTIEVIWTIGHLQHPGEDSDFSPLGTELPSETLEIDGSRLSDGVDWVA